jgi:hypothetical protein
MAEAGNDLIVELERARRGITDSVRCGFVLSAAWAGTVHRIYSWTTAAV